MTACRRFLPQQCLPILLLALLPGALWATPPDTAAAHYVVPITAADSLAETITEVLPEDAQRSVTGVLNTTLFRVLDYRFTLMRLVLLAAIVVMARVLVWAFRLLILHRMRRKGEPGRGLALAQLFQYGLYIAAFLVALNIIGVNLTVVAASGAALVVGLGLGLQNVFVDLTGGLLILIGGALHVDDIVVVDNHLTGRVITVGLRTSRVLTRDGVLVIVPNRKFIDQALVNWTGQDHLSRYHLRVGVAYGSDLQLVRRLLLECAAAQPEVARTPEPDVWFTDFGDSALLFELLVWIDSTTEVAQPLSSLRFAIEAAFRAHGVQIPFPQRDLHIRTMPGSGQGLGQG